MMNKGFIVKSRSYEVLDGIINKYSDEFIEKVNEDAWSYYMDRDSNARRRFLYALKKMGVTEDEWFVWAWV